jgi:hypothetical protein
MRDSTLMYKINMKYEHVDLLIFTPTFYRNILNKEYVRN